MGAAEDIVGVWRLVASTADGFGVLTGQSHAGFSADGRTWEIWPDRTVYEDQVRVESRYELDDAVDPPQIVVESEWVQPDGRVRRTEVRRGIYELEGDDLRIAWGWGDDMPEVVAGDAESLDVYEREKDPELVARYREPPRPLARKTRPDDYFGELSWDANLSWWGARIDFADTGAWVRIDASEDAGKEPFERGRAVVEHLGEHAGDVLEFAAAELVGLYNDTWREPTGRKLSAEDFAEQIRVESIHVHGDGSVELYLNDADLFAGHVIIVSLDRDLAPYDAGIAG